MDNPSQEVDIAQFLLFCIKYKKALFLFALVGIITGAIFSYTIPPKYKAEGVVMMGKVTRANGLSYYLFETDQLASELNSSLTQKYKNMKFDDVSNDTIRITDIASIREQAIKNILEAEIIILEKENTYKAKQRAAIEKLKEVNNALRIRGQSTENIELKIFDIQNELDSIAPTQVLGDVKVKQTGVGLFLSIIIGAISGLLIGLVYSAGWEWLFKNRKKS